MKHSESAKRLLSLVGWRQFFKILNKKEKIVFSAFLISALTSSFFLLLNFYFKNTEIKPDKGGTYIEGALGHPRFINPVYAASSDVDRDLVELVYSGLMKYDESAKIVPDLAKDYKISDGGKIYEFYLKENLFWQDGTPLTADDVIFTIKTIQNPAIKSPIIADWLGIAVEKISDTGIRFTLKNPSAVFLENTTLKILPKHVWQDVSTQNFPLSNYNLKPIGSGPYKIKDFSQNKEGNIQSLELVANPYSNKQPNVSKIIFYFFEKEEDLIKSFDKKKINGFSLLSVNKYKKLEKTSKWFSEYRLELPRYFAVFFNDEKSEILSEKNIRQALNYGTNKKELVSKILLERGKTVDSPILPDIYGFEEPKETYQYSPKTAKNLLEKAGFSLAENGTRVKNVSNKAAFQFKNSLVFGSTGQEVKELQKCLAKDPEVYPEGEITGRFGDKTKVAVIRFQEKYKEDILEPSGLKAGTGEVKKSTIAKLNELCAAPSEETIPLSFVLTTVDQPVMKDIAELLKEQWKQLGVSVEIKTVNISQLEQEIIKPRNYEMLLFGEVLEAVPDPFPFWHSSQKNDPGLNLALYENKNCDKLLEEVRQTLNEEKIKSSLEKFQNILINDAPAIFLYSPDYVYLVSKDIKGIDTKIIVDPSKRFSGIENWYIETKRVWK